MEHLSPDALQLILEYCNADDLGTLMFCGSKAMNLRIVHETTSFDLKLKTHRSLAWPRFLLGHMAQLRHLKVRFDYKWTLFVIADFSWSSLPSSLVTLELETSSRTFDTSSHPFGLDVVLPNLRTLSLIYFRHENHYLKDMPRFIDWCPQLERLKWRSQHHIDETPCLLLAGLPNTLTDLDFTCSGIIEDDEDGSWPMIWPESLTRLSLETSLIRNFNRFIYSLPQTITSLALDPLPFYWDQYSDEDDVLKTDWSFSHLPKLQDLMIMDENLSSRIIPLISRNLRSLTFLAPTNDAFIECLSNLPPDLTKLGTKGYMSLDLTGKSILDALPPSLTDMQGLSFFPYILEHHPFPSRLKTLKLHGVPHHGFLELNTAVTSLDIEVSGYCLSPEQWPTNLKSLSISGLFDFSALQFLPHSLSNLEIACDNYENISLSYLWSKLPPELKEISCDIGDVHLAGGSSRLLPRTLKSLTLSNTFACDTSWFEDLPPSLESLRLWRVSDLTSLHLEALKNFHTLRFLHVTLPYLPDSGLTPYLRHMPRSLHSLAWRVIAITRNSKKAHGVLQNSDMALLPRGLVSLHIPSSPSLTEDCSIHLPLYLVDFNSGEELTQLIPWRHPNSSFKPVVDEHI